MKQVQEARVTTELVCTKNFVFDRTNLLELSKALNGSDKNKFCVDCDVTPLEYADMHRCALLFFRKWILKENIDDVEKAKKHHEMLQVIDYSLHAVLFAIIGSLAYFSIYMIQAIF
jgi:hypothetical protein